MRLRSLAFAWYAASQSWNDACSYSRFDRPDGRTKQMMTLKLRKRFWLSGMMGLALAVSVPVGAQATGRGGETFNRSGTVFDRSNGASSWRYRLGVKYGKGYHTHGGRGSQGGPTTGGGGGGGGDPEAPEPTAALLFGAGLLAIRGAARRGRAR
jgi:hypothetical protein